MKFRTPGFVLLPVILAMSVVATIAFLLNRDNGLTVRRITQQADFERARYIAEAGLQAVNSTVQAAGCNGVFPTSSSPVSKSFAGGSYTAFSKSPGGSPLELVATGVYNGASVTLNRTNVYVYQARKTTTLQPGSGQDTYVNIGFPDRNYGRDNIMRLYTANYQPLIKFDLTSFPSGTRVTPWYDTSTNTLKAGATMSLYQSQVGSTSATAIKAQLITQAWQAGTRTGGGSGIADGATWNTSNGSTPWAVPGPSPTPGVGYLPTPVAITAYKNSTGWVDWDLTDAVAWWLKEPVQNPNYGVWLVESGGNIGDTYYTSSDASGGGQRPKLTVNYLQPCTSSLALTISPAADVYIKGGTDADNNFGGAPVIDTAYTTPGPERRILLKFDMTPIPVNSTLKTATLRLYCTTVTSASNTAKSINAYFVMTAWLEGTMSGAGTANGATWNARSFDPISGKPILWGAPGGAFDVDIYKSWVKVGKEEASGASPLPGAFRQGWVTFDLKDLVQYWSDNRTSATANNGVILIFPSTISDIIEFESRETASGNAPQLVVTY